MQKSVSGPSSINSTWVWYSDTLRFQIWTKNVVPWGPYIRWKTVLFNSFRTLKTDCRPLRTNFSLWKYFLPNYDSQSVPRVTSALFLDPPSVCTATLININTHISGKFRIEILSLKTKYPPLIMSLTHTHSTQLFPLYFPTSHFFRTLLPLVMSTSYMDV